jgi:NADPH:quinone reductase-like Zn-dependent oxidoreductase
LAGELKASECEQSGSASVAGFAWANPDAAKSSHLQTGGKGMRAIVIEEFGGVEKLELENVDDPEVGAGEVLVRVRATSVNPVDWKIRSGASKGRFDVELPAILGRDLAGEVERAGEGVIGFAKGQRVMAMAKGLTPNS